MTASPRRERDTLVAMLRRVWEVSGLRLGDVARDVGLGRSTLRNWYGGNAVPSPEREREFRSVVRVLQQAAGGSVYTDDEWTAALYAAREEATGVRDRQIPTVREKKNPDRRLIQKHGPAIDTHRAEVRGRQGERTSMNAFVRDSSPGAPAYLCWHADAPVGKTLLLTDYVLRSPPPDADILTFFVSSAPGTDTRADFEKEMAVQIGEFPDIGTFPVPRGVPEWKRLFTKAAKKSTDRGRKLLLVVDGLDDDVAWSGLASESGTAGSRAVGEAVSGTAARSGRRPARGSIAALLPASPPPGMRVIASLRRCVRFPDDLAKRHPLRQGRHLRTLLPVPGVPLLRQPPPDATALGATVAGLLAVAGGGLRTADLAELTGLPTDRLDRLAQGPAGRSLVLDDPVFQTYALAEPRLVHSVLGDLGEAGVARHTRELLAWSREWRAAGWPERTPPYALAHQLRLLTGPAERAAYVLDLPRLRRLAGVAGQAAALAQLDAFEEEIGAGDGPEEPASLVPLTAVRALLRGESRDVPDGAAALLVRLGEVERARGLARSAPTAIDRAVQLAYVAVEMAYAEQAGVDAVVREAVQWTAHHRVDRGFPPAYQDPGAYTRLLEAARALLPLNGPAAARPLVRAVVQDQAAGTDTLIEAAGMLRSVQDLDAVAVLYDRAADLSVGGMRARTAAVELWGALAQAAPSLGPHLGDRIEAVCAELDSSDGLGAVDVLASSASALARLPAGRQGAARKLLWKALARMADAVPAPTDAGALPEDDEAHLRRELAGTLARLAQATEDADVRRRALDDITSLMDSLPEHLRIGILGDPLLERAKWVVEAAEERRSQADREASAAARKKQNAKRRAKDKSNTVYKRDREKKREPLGEAGAQHPTAREGPAEDSRPGLRRAPAVRRPDTHRPTMGLPSLADVPHAEQQPHLRLLREADRELGAGRLLRSRELWESALRHSPAAPQASSPASESWVADLCQALGVVGEFGAAEVLVADLPDEQDRARHLAALSLGCSLGGHGDAGARYADAAARRVSDGTDPGLANLVAQALAHAGDGPTAISMVRGDRAVQRRTASTAVAAGLVRHRPAQAARIAEGVVAALVLRIGEAPIRTLPELAALFLAFPDVRQPDPRLREALRRAVRSLTETPMPWHAPSMAVLTLLERLGCLAEEDAHVVEGPTDRWRRSLRPGHEAGAEVALLAAVDGDIAGLWRHAEAVATPDERWRALHTAAAYLSGAPVALSTDHRAGDRVTRTCLALARASGDDGPPAEATARDIVRSLVNADAWTHVIPLLPRLAPGAPAHLSTIAAHRRRGWASW
ncbi:hypothetical protein [Streptomyces tagetis]|uniref:Uncharacterized protein n=1 Tax=Streptomyces tagetis TaxID=2820809 RepID=A0A941B7W3_9ACTN|nr:hypothetical protein [Streptomyces sp. RG38]MBQ0827878.1 hypothetical protein [Streptomyces sp. RG38]